MSTTQEILVSERELFAKYGSTAGDVNQRAYHCALERAGLMGVGIIDSRIEYQSRDQLYRVFVEYEELKPVEPEGITISIKEAQMLFHYLASHACPWSDSDNWIKLYERLKNASSDPTEPMVVHGGSRGHVYGRSLGDPDIDHRP
jgi:hypothetical protein